MQESAHHLAWSYLRIGPRPSTLLGIGAIVNALGPILLHLKFETVGWLAWALGLLLVGLALLMSGLRPWLTIVAVVPAALFLLQCISLCLAGAGVHLAARAYAALSVPKLLALVVLALVARGQVARRRRRWLLVAAGLGALKPLLRYQDTLPAKAFVVLDPLLTVLLACALVMFAIGLRRLETAWAVVRHEQSTADLADFNPEPQPPTI
jgi:hypothetical protein